MKREGGFTLIELMIVILIIAILVAIAIPVYISIQDNANNNTAKANMRTIDGAVSAYKAAAGGSDPVSGDLVPTYLKKWPTGPKSWTYTLSGANPASASCSGIGTY